LQQLPAEDRALWQGSGQQPEQAAVAASASESERRQAFWWTLLLLALVIALAEIYLANPFLGRRKAVLPSDGLKENLYVSP
jgi:hypothetical protein